MGLCIMPLHLEGLNCVYCEERLFKYNFISLLLKRLKKENKVW